jgi:LacI family transcriptional regulator, galactose operon repressor
MDTGDHDMEMLEETFSAERVGTADAANGRRPTMKQVAALAGVSLATVSRVVNGGPSVRPDLATRVREAVELLGYRHNLTASSLRRADRLSASIGLIFEDVANPFFSAVHRGVEDVARERGVLTFAGSSDERPERERELAESFSARRVDGLIIAPASADHSYLQRDRAAGVALVFVDRPASFVDADVVLTDNAGGARNAVTHLIERGHRRIAFLGDRPELHTATERLRGYRDALARHGIGEEVALIRGAHHRPYEVTREILLGHDPPTALFTSQNLITIDAVRALHDLGMQRAVALIGFDDVALADVVEPGLTVVAQDPAALGRSAAELLFSRLDGHTGPSRRVVHPTRLIARGSGELTPGARS